MKKQLTLLLFAAALTASLAAQPGSDTIDNRDFTIRAGLQFQNFTLPFRDMGSHFSHPGLFVGAEVPLNRKGSVALNAVVGGYANKEMGNGLYAQSQAVWQPRWFGRAVVRLQGGVGYLRVSHPAQTFRFTDGAWHDISGGKSQLIIPFDLSAGYVFDTPAGRFTPFVSYQVAPALFYNDALPLNIYTSVLAGIHIQLKKTEQP